MSVPLCQTEMVSGSLSAKATCWPSTIWSSPPSKEKALALTPLEETAPTTAPSLPPTTSLAVDPLSFSGQWFMMRSSTTVTCNASSGSESKLSSELSSSTRKRIVGV